LNDHDGRAGQRSGRFDASGITEIIRRSLDSAGLNTASGAMKRVTETIEQALAAAGLTSRRSTPDARSTPYSRGTTIDGTAWEVDATTNAPAATDRSVMREDTAAEVRTESASTADASPTAEASSAAQPSSAARPLATPDAPFRANAPAPSPGEFLARSFTNAAGTRAYKVYVPAGHSVTSTPAMPMIVMLHGCTQSPDDFAAGTRMNALADEHGFVVVYPEQCTKANKQKCWNWFRTEDQGRESGEPTIIAGITHTVASTYGIDRRRIFVAGMSAGAAMAVILGAMFPDLYAAVGAHSGLAYGAARDVPSAFAAMHGAGDSSRSAPHAAIAVPTIVFHGDGDHTVNARNATRIVEQAVARFDDPAVQTHAKSGTSAGGRKWSRVDYVDASNQIAVEQWTVHGVGHAWSGGSAAGSFTDARGPDASQEMIRFFLSLPRAGTA
jgi:poly(hydroxyalkanoate) depolymerase family esterase